MRAAEIVLDKAPKIAINKIQDGQNAFRFNTFGDQAFWGGQLQLQQAVAQLSPNSALGLGLKVDLDAKLRHAKASAYRGRRIFRRSSGELAAAPHTAD